MKRTRLLLLYSLLSVLTGLLLASCSTGSFASPVGEWALISFGNAANPTPALPNVETSINFGEEGQLNGNVGCNGFGADYKVKGDEIAMGSIMSTMMFCEQTSAQESTVLGILSDKTVTYKLDGNQLTILSQDGMSVIVLARK